MPFDPVAIFLNYGTPGLLIIAVLAFYFDLVVTGKRYQKQEEETEEWKKLALELGGISRTAVTLVERHVPRGRGVGEIGE
jgi:hypothetical protein